MTRVTSPLSERFFSRAFTRTRSPASAPRRSLRATSTGRRSSTKSGSATEYFPRRTSMAGRIKRALPRVSGKARPESITQHVFLSIRLKAAGFRFWLVASGIYGRLRAARPVRGGNGGEAHKELADPIEAYLPDACSLKPEAFKLYLPEEPRYGEEAADDAYGRAHRGEQQDQERDVHCFGGYGDEGEGVVGPLDEEVVDPDDDQGGDNGADEALEQSLEDERGPDEAVGGAYQLHHLDLLAPGKY